MKATFKRSSLRSKRRGFQAKNRHETQRRRLGIEQLESRLLLSTGEISGYWNGNVVWIPDNGGDSGNYARVSLDVSGAPAGAVITDVDIYYEVKHTYRGDLRVWATTYAGGTWDDWVMWNRPFNGLGNDSGDNIAEWEPGIDDWDNISANREWWLVAGDYDAGIEGYLDFFEVHVHWYRPDPEPDLVARGIRVDDTTVEPEQRVRVDWTAENWGVGSAGSTDQGVMWSTNATITDSDTELSVEPLSSMSVGETDPENEYVYIPANATRGQTYYIGVIADYYDDENESNEGNNNDGPPVAVTVNPAIRTAQIQSGDIQRDSYDPLESVRLDVAVANTGNVRLDGLWLNVDVADPNGTNVREGLWLDLPNLDPNTALATGYEDFWTPPVDAIPGTYTVAVGLRDSGQMYDFRPSIDTFVVHPTVRAARIQSGNVEDDVYDPLETARLNVAVENTGNVRLDGLWLNVDVADPNGTTVREGLWRNLPGLDPNTALATGYEDFWTPPVDAIPGTYTVAVGLRDSERMYDFWPSIDTFEVYVNPAARIQSGNVDDDVYDPLETARLNVAVENTGNVRLDGLWLNVDVADPNGTTVREGLWRNLPGLDPNTALATGYEDFWTPPVDAIPGTYTVAVGLRDSGRMYDFWPSIDTFEVYVNHPPRIQSGNVEDDAYYPLETARLNVAVENAGNVRLDGLWLNVDVADPNGTTVREGLWLDLPSLDPNTALATGYQDFWTPPVDAIPGTYTVAVGLRDSGQIYDIWPSIDTFEVLVAPIAADLLVTGVTPDPVVAGNIITIDYSITNTGNIPHSFGVGTEFQSGGALIEHEEGQDWPPQDWTPTIAVGDSYSNSLTYTIPPEWAEGTYSAWAAVWSGSPGSSTWLDSGGRDFDVSHVSATVTVERITPTPVMAGAAITVDYVVTNTASIPHRFGIASEVWSGASLIEPDVGSALTTTIPPNGSYNGSLTYFVPPDWETGTYTGRVVARSGASGMSEWLSSDDESFLVQQATAQVGLVDTGFSQEVYRKGDVIEAYFVLRNNESFPLSDVALAVVFETPGGLSVGGTNTESFTVEPNSDFRVGPVVLWDIPASVVSGAYIPVVALKDSTGQMLEVFRPENTNELLPVLPVGDFPSLHNIIVRSQESFSDSDATSVLSAFQQLHDKGIAGVSLSVKLDDGSGDWSGVTPGQVLFNSIHATDSARGAITYDLYAQAQAAGADLDISVDPWIPTFYDRAALEDNPEWQLPNQSSYFTDASNPLVRQYETDIISDALGGPYSQPDRVYIDHFRYTSGQRSPVHITDFLAGVDQDVPSGTDLAGYLFLPRDTHWSGQDYQQLEPYLDIFSPMLYWQDWGVDSSKDVSRGARDYILTAIDDIENEMGQQFVSTRVTAGLSAANNVNGHGFVDPIAWKRAQFNVMGACADEGVGEYDLFYHGEWLSDINAAPGKWVDRAALLASLAEDVGPEIDIEISGQAADVQDYDFGSVLVGAAGSMSFTVRNEGSSVLTVTEASGLTAPFTISPDNSTSGTDDWSIYPGKTKAFTLIFSPSANRPYNDSLFVHSDDTDEPVYEISLTGKGSANPGDANLDGVTDLSDFNIWNASKFTQGTNWTTGDFNGDRITDLSDFNIWNAHKFTGAPVPTPRAHDTVLEIATAEDTSGEALKAGELGWLRELVQLGKVKQHTEHAKQSEQAVDKLLASYWP